MLEAEAVNDLFRDVLLVDDDLLRVIELHIQDKDWGFRGELALLHRKVAAQLAWARVSLAGMRRAWVRRTRA